LIHFYKRMSKKGGGKERGPVDTTSLYKELAALRPSSEFDPQQEDYEKAIKVCNKILNLEPGDGTAFQCKVVAMIQAGKFLDCLKQIENSKHGLELSFEVAYCHYRLNEPAKALEVLDTVITPSVKHTELRAQVLYRLEDYARCYGVYRDLIKESDDNYETERSTNLSAVTAHLGDASKMLVDCNETFEQQYNAGCNYAAVGDLVKAEAVLTEAKQAAETFLGDEEASQEEILEETGIIKVQLGYVMQRQGREKEAQTIYNQVLRSKPADSGLVAVASNNLLAINGDQNIFDSKKRLKAASVEGLELKLTSRQRASIQRNAALLAMFTAQVEQCKQLVASLACDEGERREIVAGVLARSGRHKEAVEELKSGTGAPPPVTTLTAAQILLTAGEVGSAISELEKLPPSWLYRTGVLSTMVTLLLAKEDRKGAANLLKEAVEWNKTNKALSKAGMAVVWRKTAEFHLKSGEAEVAAASLEELQKLQPSLTTLAQLVTAYAKFNLEKALEVSKKLPPFSAESVDVTSLESGNWGGARLGKKTPKAGEKTPKAGDTGDGLLVQKKRKSKKKKRLPKNYNPNAEPDPERWLPKKERTGLKYMPGYRKPRKDKRKGEKFTGAQGTTPGQEQTYDYSGKLEKSKEAAAKQASPEPSQPTPGPRSTANRPQNKPKKKGGKKRF